MPGKTSGTSSKFAKVGGGASARMSWDASNRGMTQMAEADAFVDPSAAADGTGSAAIASARKLILAPFSN